MTEVDVPAAAAEETAPVEKATPEAENGVGENGVHENGADKEEAPAAEEPAEEKSEPAAKKVKKMKKEVSGNRRSSSRLVNIDSGVTLPKEISSDNIEGIKKGRV